MTTGNGYSPGILGIDAGGTFTDLVFIDAENDTILATAKTPTRNENISQTIENGLNMMLQQIDAAQICSFNLATTLATNAIVEDRLHTSALLLIGYEEDLVQEAIASDTFHTPYVSNIPGGHDMCGNEQAPLDETAVKTFLRTLPTEVEAIAVSAFFSVRNPIHENRAIEIIREIRPDLYITCGHDLSTELNAFKRATTAVLNAGLIPIVMDLLDSVKRVCARHHINVPITVVQGDGTVVSADWAKDHPVEMILSGPAASACGACFLAQAGKTRRPAWVVDMGGTTTDIIHLDEKGQPILLDSGATVANHKTLVKAIDIYTFGLGGDSRVLVHRDHSITLGNRRVRPICTMAVDYPQITEELTCLVQQNICADPLVVISTGEGNPENDFEEFVLDHLAEGPCTRENLLAGVHFPDRYFRRLEMMEEKGLVKFAAFTPTDALHVLGQLNKWDEIASLRAAELMTDGSLFQNPRAVASMVCRLTIEKISTALMKKVLAVNGMPLRSSGDAIPLLERVIRKEGSAADMIQLHLNAHLVGAGAPAWAFLPSVGETLHEKALLPEYSKVAGAVGAAVGTFSLSYTVKILPDAGENSYRVHYPLGVKDFKELDEACAFTSEFMQPWLTERAKRAGANNPQVSCEREDCVASIGSIGATKFLCTNLQFRVKNV